MTLEVSARWSDLMPSKVDVGCRVTSEVVAFQAPSTGSLSLAGLAAGTKAGGAFGDRGP